VEPKCVDKDADRRVCRTACDCSGCSRPAAGSHGVSRHLYFVERLEEPIYGLH
jgi:hypothetical protein